MLVDHVLWSGPIGQSATKVELEPTTAIDQTLVASQVAPAGVPMAISHFSYPDQDEVPYLEWFGPHFPSVFVALNPFIRIHDGEPFQNGNGTPPEVIRRAKRCGQACSVTWEEVASLCGFATVAEVNQSLRLTGSKRLIPEFASPKNTATLLKRCRENNLYPPDEGLASPPFEWSFASFARASGQDSLLAADGFSSKAEQLKVSQLADPEELNEFAEFAAPDDSFYATIYTHYHYWLICQTSGSLSKARPEKFFEGFYAGIGTNDLWGLVQTDPEGKPA